MASLLTHRLSILAAAALFSTGGAAIKGCGLDGWQVASFRSATAALMFVLFLPASRRAWSWRTGLVGLAYAGTMISFVLSNKLWSPWGSDSSSSRSSRQSNRPPIPGPATSSPSRQASSGH